MRWFVRKRGSCWAAGPYGGRLVEFPTWRSAWNYAHWNTRGGG